VLQLAYQAAGARYGVVVSIDGRGAVTRHLPEEGEVAAALERGGAVALAHAYQLDDAPGYERFFLVTGERPFDVAPVVEAARWLAAAGQARAGALTLPGGLEQRAVLVVKR
jgi:streptogramin lyase